VETSNPLTGTHTERSATAIVDESESCWATAAGQEHTTESVLILAVLAQSCRSRGRTLVYRSGEMLSSPRCLQVEPVMAAEHALWRCSPPAWHVTRPSPLRALFLEHLETRPRWPSNHLRVSPGGPHTAPVPHSLTGRYHEAGPLSLTEGDRGEGKSQRCSYLSWLAVLGAGLSERAGGTWARQ
jgi:hypothetical protein